jgi:hypothetical protein
MKRHFLAVTLMLLATTAASAADAPASQPAATQPQSFSERYDVIAQRNIFLRERSRPRDPTNDSTASSRPSEAAPLTPEQAYVLRGIVLEESDLRAYFEDKRTGEVTRVATGAILGEGQVTEIQIDSVRFQNAGQWTWVEIGHDLTGARSGGGAGGPASGPTASPVIPGTSDPALMSVEERMRQRRQQRSNRK